METLTTTQYSLTSDYALGLDYLIQFDAILTRYETRLEGVLEGLPYQGDADDLRDLIARLADSYDDFVTAFAQAHDLRYSQVIALIAEGR